MNLKREREEDIADLFQFHAPKKQRTRVPKLRIKQEALFTNFHIPSLPPLDDSWEPEDFLSTEENESKKKSLYKNVFWGTKQLAWLGSVRVNGTIVRSCSRKSDELAAKILNTRCKDKGITPPNPEAGFLSIEELQAHTAIRSKGKKGALDTVGKKERNILPKIRKKTKRSRGSGRSSPFKNIFWGTQQKAWMGNIRVRGTIVRSCSRKSDVQAAKILNSRCRVKGIAPPNPEVGFIDAKLEAKYLRKSSNSSKDLSARDNTPIIPRPKFAVSGQYISNRRSLGMENKDHRNPMVKLEKNLKIYTQKPMVKLEKDFSSNLLSSYSHVSWSNLELGWFGSYELPSGRVLTALSHESARKAAQMLNTKCKNEGYAPPNPLAGFFKTDEQHSSDFSCKVESPGDFFTADFQSLLNLPLNNSSDSARAFKETVELPPPIVDFDDGFKCMNNLMFNYLTDLLPNVEISDEKSSFLADDLPLTSSFLM